MKLHDRLARLGMLPIEQASSEGWVTPSQAARLLGLSVARVRQLCEQGRLRVEKTVLGRLIDPASITAEQDRRKPSDDG